MKLEAEIVDDTLIVHQLDGFSVEAKVILRSIHYQWKIENGTIWKYPATEGALVGLKQAAEFLEAEVDADTEILDRLDKISGEISRERKMRSIFQGYMDNPQLNIDPYTTRQNPPPWRHQQISYHWGMRVNNLYLAHKPGLGKTREGADLIRGKIERDLVRPPYVEWVDDHYSEINPKVPIYGHYATRGGVLVICPKIVLGTWKDELKKWQNIEALVINTSKRQAKASRASQPWWVHICTYDSLDILEDNEYDGIIADEAHYLANEDTQRYAKALWIRKKAKWVVALSGTPVSNMLPSLWAQYYWLDFGRTLGGSFEDYRRRYFDGSTRKMTPKENAAENIAKQISRVTYFLTMQEAFPDKPQKISQVVRVPMTAEQLEYYEKVHKQTVTDIQTGQVSSELINIKMLKLMQICQGFIIDDEKKTYTFNSSKLNTLKEMITGQGDMTDQRVVIWCQFKHDLRQVVQMLVAAGIPVLYLHGQMSSRDREYVKNTWNTDYRYRVMVGMIQIGIGINLHAPNCVDNQGLPARCSTTIFFGLNWRVTQLEQAMDRVYRGDQVETCLYRYLLSDDVDGIFDDDGKKLKPMDVRVYDTLQEKLEQAAMISDESVSYVRRLLGLED